MQWEVKGLNYWENPNCPRAYLDNALIGLVEFVEGVALPSNYFSHNSNQEVRNEIERYEYLADK